MDIFEHSNLGSKDSPNLNNSNIDHQSQRFRDRVINHGTLSANSRVQEQQRNAPDSLVGSINDHLSEGSLPIEQPRSNSDDKSQDQEQDWKHVLIANDDELQLFVLTTIFERSGFVVTTAKNGFEAFSKVKQSIQTIREIENMSPNNSFSKNLFDLIVLDLNMPITNGYDACKLIVKFYSQQKLLQLQDGSKAETTEDNSAVNSQNSKAEHLMHHFSLYRPLLLACTSYVDDDVLT
mmetsp:Transcript_34459/g.52735  ORF Transcript_34459/g.52735 Transcript_34459/m.52735 type:complete len:236 (+) Transcript_34459:2942-3649(+)|eukprot:CAMPEP_0170511042 /NCGR_PEP_ID=MMETSP0208-20121228/66088_1 /TAXON_ID=197538 /ORGANISM="Strombidium inclinatum, Strain S3" /LENGTH=235 /DNA_ID=CAMNT_0010794547 /DNA_START=4084 /DNA_END=4791 /DNA_ORIENTATION=-